MTDAPGRPAQRRLYREPEDRKLAGVCSGLADYLGVDPTVVRLVVVLLTLGTWFGAVVYLIAACVVPRRPTTEPRVQAEQSVLPESANAPLAVGLLVLVAVVVVFDRPWFDLPTIGLLLVGLGVWLLFGDRDDRDRGPTAIAPGNPPTARGGGTTLPGEVVPPPGTTDHTTELLDPSTRVEPPVPEGASSADPQGEVPPPVPPWGLGSPTRPLVPPPIAPADLRGPRSGTYVLAVLLLGAGALALLGVLDIASPSFATVVAGGLVVVGAAMAVGAFRGRARWLAVLGVPAIGLLMVDDVASVPLDAGAGDRVVMVAESGRNADDHELSLGSLTLDLRDVEGNRADPPRIEASVGIGELQVLVPADMEARVDASVGLGDIDGTGVADNGAGEIDLHREFTVERAGDTPEGEGRLVELDLRVDLGEVEVIHG